MFCLISFMDNCSLIVFFLLTRLLFSKIFDRDFTSIEFTLFSTTCTYLKLSNTLKTRIFSEEDNDDVVEILESDTSRLRDFYGEFYVSEMLRHPDQTRRLVVGEKGPNHIGAVACLNRRVNLRLLNETFDLGAFGNLRKRDEPTWSFDDFYRGKG